MTDHSKRHNAPGFTLVELLVVMALIALLAMLTVPTLSGIYRVAHRTTCANNLKRIGQAVTLLSGSGPGGQEVRLRTERWQLQLGRYIGEGGVFICPAGDGEEQAIENIPLTDLTCIHVTSTGYDLEFIEGPYVAKLSDEQFQAVDFVLGVRYDAPAYNPGVDPRMYWYILEDVPFEGGDHDFDIGVRVLENGDGTLTLSVKQITFASYDFNLVDKLDDRKILVRKHQMDGTPGNEVVVGEASGMASYGMNAEFNSTSNDGEKIMVLDYPWFLARSDHDWSSDRLAGNIPGIPIFARHYGKINVLFTDGSVRLRRPDEVNPADPAIQRTLWNE